MLAYIEYPKDHLPVKAQGRNGLFKAEGIEVCGGSSDSSVYVSNITSKGFIGNGWIALPPEPATLRELAVLLEKLAVEIES